MLDDTKHMCVKATNAEIFMELATSAFQHSCAKLIAERPKGLRPPGLHNCLKSFAGYEQPGYIPFFLLWLFLSATFGASIS